MASGSSIESRLVGRLGAPRIADRAVDHEMRHVDALRLQLARHRLREPAQRELAHREGRGLRIALHARRGAGEEDRAEALREACAAPPAAPTRKPPKALTASVATSAGIEIDKRPAHPAAGVVDDDVGRAEIAAPTIGEKARDLIGVGGVAGKGARAGLARRAPRACPGAARQARRFRPSRARSRASEALSPAPAPTISAL